MGKTLLANMRFDIISNFVLGTYFLLVLHVLSIKVEVNVQPYPRRFGNTYSLITRSEHHDGNVSPADSIKSAASEPKAFGKPQSWTGKEEERLLRLRGQGLPWSEVAESFPERSFRSIESKYFKLKGSSTKKNLTSKRWTNEEKELLLELIKTDASEKEKAQHFPGRTIGAVQNKSTRLRQGLSFPEGFKRRYTAEEDELLLKLVKEGIPWKDRVRFFDGRTEISLRRRLYSLKSPRFLVEEDRLLLRLEKEDMPWQNRLRLFNDRSLDALQKRLKWLTSTEAQVRKYTSDEDDLIVEAVESGMTVEEISQLVERSILGIKWRIKKLEGLDRFETPREKERHVYYTDDEFRLMIESVEKGMSLQDINAEHFPERTFTSLKSAYYRYRRRKRKEEEQKQKQ